jgi:hypothetical protein
MLKLQRRWQVKLSCYFRHLKEVFESVGIEVTPQNRKSLDAAFHHVVGVEYKDCSATWKQLKQDWLSDPKKKQELGRKLKEALH